MLTLKKNFPEHELKKDLKLANPEVAAKVFQLGRFTRRISNSLKKKKTINHYEELFKRKFDSSHKRAEDLDKLLDNISNLSKIKDIWEIWKKIALFEYEFRFELRQSLREQKNDYTRFDETEEIIDILLNHPISFI